jgi:O-antigen/teichoic acid export membrane protein
MSDIPKKSLETLVIRLINQAASVVAGILMARVLGAFGKGIFTYASSITTVIQTISMGQASAVSWQYRRRKRPSAVVLAALQRLLVLGAIPISVIIAVVALTVRGQRPLLAVAVALPFLFLAQMTLGFFLADGDVRKCNIQASITSVGFLAALIPAYFVFHLGLDATLAIWVGATVCSALYSLWMLRPYARYGITYVAEAFKEQFMFGLKVSANSVVALLNFRIDVFIILFMLGAKALGIYSIAVGAGELMWQLSRPLGYSAFQRINSDSRDDAIYITAKCVRHALAMVGIGCLALFFVAPPLVTLVYGRAFSAAGPALRFLLPGIMAFSMTPFFSGFFTQQLGKPVLPLIVSSASTIICAIITVIAVPHIGIVGGAIGTSVSYTAAFFISMTLFLRETGMPISKLYAFGAEDFRPYKELVSSIWVRTLRLAAGGQSSNSIGKS